MKPVKRIQSRTVVLPTRDIDTDQIIPARFLTTTSREGLGESLFHDLRFDKDGSSNNDFVLNKPESEGAAILVAGNNFGCGSSREHAVWALTDHGIRVVIAPSFADIFFHNCHKNGLLPIVLDEEIVERLFNEVMENHGYRLLVDLPSQKIILPNDEEIEFEIDPFRKHCHIHGLDDIGLTLEHAAEISAFEEKHRQAAPWLYDTPHQ